MRRRTIQRGGRDNSGEQGKEVENTKKGDGESVRARKREREKQRRASTVWTGGTEGGGGSKRMVRVVTYSEECFL